MCQNSLEGLTLSIGSSQAAHISLLAPMAPSSDKKFPSCYCHAKAQLLQCVGKVCSGRLTIWEGTRMVGKPRCQKVSGYEKIKKNIYRQIKSISAREKMSLDFHRVHIPALKIQFTNSRISKSKASILLWIPREEESTGFVCLIVFVILTKIAKLSNLSCNYVFNVKQETLLCSKDLCPPKHLFLSLW